MTQPEITCPVHLGLIRVALAEMDAPLELTDLEPFVKPPRASPTCAPSAASGTRTRPGPATDGLIDGPDLQAGAQSPGPGGCPACSPRRLRGERTSAPLRHCVHVILRAVRIAVANLKGGVGKSTSAVHLAAGLARRGRTLLVD